MLLLANLLFVAWARWIAPPAPLAGLATPSAPDRRAIRLLREASRVDAAVVPTRGRVAAGSGEPANCVSAGPFLERAEAVAAAGALERLGFKSRLRPATDAIRVGAWVRVADLATAEDAANALSALRAAGLEDAEIVADDAAANVISVGVFGEPERAAQAAETVRKAGFAPETSDRTRTADVFWLDVDRLENGSLPGLEALGAGPGPAAPALELRACPVGTPEAG